MAHRSRGWHGGKVARAAGRIGGPDLMQAVIDRGRTFELRHALFGSTSIVSGALAERCRERFLGVNLVDIQSPNPGEEDDDERLSQLTAARPHIVWCALGAPKQELWMHRTAKAVAPAVLVGVGAAFDFRAEQSSGLRCGCVNLDWNGHIVLLPSQDA